MQETSLYHLLTQHPIITFVVCAVLLMFLITIAGIKLMRHLDKKRAEEENSGDNK